jgi:hypothetical protein
MLNKLELAFMRILVDQYLERYGNQMAREIPVPYLVLRSAQTKLREMKPADPQAH